MKRWTAVLLITALFTACILPATAQSPSTPAQFKTETELLKAINLLPASFDLSKEASRAEFVKLLIEILFPDTDLSKTGDMEGKYFADVPKEHPYYPYIKACRDIGIISGDMENNFYPDRTITTTEAVTIVVNALGYTTYANAYGGYPSGYFSIAREAGITDGIDVSAQKVMGDIVVKLLYNALFADLVTIESVTADGKPQLQIDKTKNILSQQLKIQQYDAIVIDNGILSTDGSSLNDNERVALKDSKTEEKITVYIGKTDISAHLGSRVKVFIKYNGDTGRNEIVYYTMHRNTKEITINADRIININSSHIEYEPEKDSEKYLKLSLGSQLPFIVLNGSHLTDYNWNSLIPDDGFIRAVCNDGNQVDFLEIISFNIYDNGVKGTARNLVVDQADEDELYISCKLNPANSLDLDSKKASFRFLMSSGFTSLRDLNKNDIVSVAQSPEPIDGKSFYYLAVSSQTSEGEITSTSSSTKEIFLGDNGYEVSESLLSVKPKLIESIAFGQSITTHLDITGKIALIDSVVQTTKNYAYLIGAQIEDSISDTLTVKVFTKDGEIKTLPVRSKVQIDGKTCKTVEEALTLLKTRPAGAISDANAPLSRPVILDVSSNEEVTRIDTDTPDEPDNGEITYYSSQTHIKYSQNEIDNPKALKAGYRSPRSGQIKTGSNVTIEGRFYLTSDTVILNVPDIDTHGFEVCQQYATNKQNANYSKTPEAAMAKLFEMPLEDRNYNVMYASSLSSMMTYDIQGYDIDPDTGVAGLVILRGRTDTYYYGLTPYAASNPMYIYKKKALVYDEEKEKIITKLYYTMTGSDEYSVTADLDDILCFYRFLIEGCSADATPYKIPVKPLKEGDIIRVFAQDGKLTHLERVLHADTLTGSYSAPMYPSQNLQPYSSALYGMYGMPFDERKYYAGFTNNYGVSVGYCNRVTSNQLSLLLGGSYVSDVELQNPISYCEQTFTLTGIQFPVIVLKADGKAEIRMGSLADIVSLTTNANQLDGSSLLIVKHSNFKTDQIIVVNDERRK